MKQERTKKSLDEKMLKYIPIRDDGDCWEWTGAKSGLGYGAITHNGSIIYGHRFIYELMIDKIPRGYDIDHICRNRACCNPFHLEPVTHRENVLRGNGPAAKNARKTVCYRGHSFETVIRNGKTVRWCRECYNIWHREYRKKQDIAQ